jgi:hypothetical protein
MRSCAPRDGLVIDMESLRSLALFWLARIIYTRLFSKHIQNIILLIVYPMMSISHYFQSHDLKLPT